MYLCAFLIVSQIFGIHKLSNQDFLSQTSILCPNMGVKAGKIIDIAVKLWWLTETYVVYLCLYWIPIMNVTTFYWLWISHRYCTYTVYVCICRSLIISCVISLYCLGSGADSRWSWMIPKKIQIAQASKSRTSSSPTTSHAGFWTANLSSQNIYSVRPIQAFLLFFVTTSQCLENDKGLPVSRLPVHPLIRSSYLSPWNP